MSKKNTDVINVDIMSKNTDVINVDVMSKITLMSYMLMSEIRSTFMTSAFFRHDIYINNISVFLYMTSTFMTAVFFRHDSNIYDTSVFQT
jgi:hypothetical protein